MSEQTNDNQEQTYSQGVAPTTPTQEQISVDAKQSEVVAASNGPDVETQTPQPREKKDPLPPNERVEMTSPTSSPISDKVKAKFTDFEKLGLISTPIEEFNRIVDEIPNIDLTSSESGQKWFDIFSTGQLYLMRGNAIMGALERPDSLWRQSVKNGGEELRAGRPRFGDNPDPSNLISGERAVLKLTASMGLGSIVQIPLWHTGIWITLKAPSEAELLELDRRLAMDKVVLGRMTSGLVFSNSSVYLSSYLINLALSKVYDATVKDLNLQALKETIKLTDLPTLIWGMACSIWPNGYPYEQACTVDPSKCQYVMSELLNLTKLSWTDNRALTEFQHKHMANRNAKVTPDALKRYQEEHKFQDNRVFDLNDGAVSVELRVPTLAEYEQSGIEWVDTIVNQTDQAFGTTMTEQERNEYIVNQGKATAMRQYGHWVERLVMADDGGIVVDRSTIEQTINALSADGVIQQKFFDAVSKYIDRTTISLIAIPRYECPNCHKDPAADAKAHPHLVPLDVATVFFTLLGHRRAKVIQRSAM